MYLKFLFLSLMLTFIYAQQNNNPVLFSDCGSNGQVNEVRVTGCHGTTCVLEKGTNVSIEIDFSPANPVIDLNAKQVWLISGIENTTPKVPPEACDYLLDNSCPLSLNTNYTYSYTFPVELVWPPIEMTTKWTLTNKNVGSTTVCIEYFTIIQ